MTWERAALPSCHLCCAGANELSKRIKGLFSVILNEIEWAAVGPSGPSFADILSAQWAGSRS